MYDAAINRFVSTIEINRWRFVSLLKNEIFRFNLFSKKKLRKTNVLKVSRNKINCR
jgi:hypothetical protein